MNSLLRCKRLAFESLECRRVLATLVSGSEVAATIELGAVDAHTLAVTAGDMVWLAIGETPELDYAAQPRFTIIDPSGAQVASHYNQQATDFSFTAAVSGTYQIRIEDNELNVAMAYTMRVVAWPGAVEPIDDRDADLYADWEYDVSAPSGSFNVHRFDATAGVPVSLSVEEGPVGNLPGTRPELHILDPLGRLIATRESGNTIFYTFTPNFSGRFAAIVMDVGNSEPIHYSIYATGISEEPDLPGDYNFDGAVDRDDYLVWRAYFGATEGDGLAADGNGDEVVDSADYVIWRDCKAAYDAGLLGPASIARPITAASAAVLVAVSVESPAMYAAPSREASAIASRSSHSNTAYVDAIAPDVVYTARHARDVAFASFSMKSIGQVPVASKANSISSQWTDVSRSLRPAWR